MKELAGARLLNAGLITVTGGTIGDRLGRARNLDTSVIRPVDTPHSEREGSPCSGAIWRPKDASSSGRRSRKDMLKHRGPARVFDSEEDGRQGDLRGRRERGAMSSSSGTKGRGAGPGCARCCFRRPPWRGWGSTARWRSSPTDGSAAPPGELRSGTSRPRPPGADPWPSSKKGTRSRSILTEGP